MLLQGPIEVLYALCKSLDSHDAPSFLSRGWCAPVVWWWQSIEYDLANRAGSALKGEFEGLRRSELVILVVRIGHRRAVYDGKANGLTLETWLPSRSPARGN